MAIDEVSEGRPASAIVAAARGWLQRLLARGERALDVDERRLATAQLGLLRRAGPSEPLIVVVGLVQTSAVLQFNVASPRQRRG